MVLRGCSLSGGLVVDFFDSPIMCSLLATLSVNRMVVDKFGSNWVSFATASSAFSIGSFRWRCVLATQSEGPVTPSVYPCVWPRVSLFGHLSLCFLMFLV